MPQKIIIICLIILCTMQVKSQTIQQPAEPREIAFASDTQAPMWVETLLTKSNHNKAATKLIFSNIQERNPQSLFLLGDVVNLGYSNKQWKPIDRYIRDLRNKGIKVDAALGNHEVMGQPMKGQRKFQARFPDHVRTGFVEIVDSVAVILLNSNFNTLSAIEDAKQTEWYKNTLQRLDADSSVLYIITGCHHSPFTNSKVVSPSTAVQKRFVPPFLASKKSSLFLSGHCHNFEHYQFKGKDFIVIGGGGGLHQPLKPNDEVLPDLSPDYKPMFHYLTVRRYQDRLEVTSRELKTDFTGFDEGLTLKINKTNFFSGAGIVKAKHADN